MNDNPHILKPSKAKPFPSTFLFLDTETTLTEIKHKTKLHKLRIGICQRYDRVTDRDLQFTSELFIHHKQDFISWLLLQSKNKSHLYIIAHNVVYDATILDLFRRLPKSGYQLQSIYSKGQVCIVRFANGDRKLTLLDNGNIFAGTLERWGKIFNIPKLDIDFETCTPAELEIYCRRDVEIMVKSWQTWMHFIAENDCGGFRETVGSTAFNTWRYKYLNREVYVHKDPDVLKLERAGYHGGRVEVFRQGAQWTDTYYYLDINNMYGYVMQQGLFPVGLQGHTTKLGMRRMLSYLERYAIMARVTLDTDEPVYLTKVNGHAAYPLGRFETVLTTQELKYALLNGHLESVQEFSWYKQTDLFRDYVNDFYNLRLHYRQQGNQGFEQICKLLVNSLYGKFGQTGLDQHIIGKASYDEIWHISILNAQTGRQSYQTALGGTIYETISQGESYHALPVIAAHVTAAARLYLWSLIKQARRENVYYCDTDSLIVNQAGYYNLEHLIEPDTLGKLKIELQSPWLIVNAPKDYAMEGRSKIKGIRANAIQLNDNTYLQEQWVKLAGLIRQGFKEGYTSKEIEKQQQRIIYSGVVTDSGRVEPFQL